MKTATARLSMVAIRHAPDNWLAECVEYDLGYCAETAYLAFKGLAFEAAELMGHGKLEDLPPSDDGVRQDFKYGLQGVNDDCMREVTVATVKVTSGPPMDERALLALAMHAAEHPLD